VFDSFSGIHHKKTGVALCGSERGLGLQAVRWDGQWLELEKPGEYTVITYWWGFLSVNG